MRERAHAGHPAFRGCAVEAVGAAAASLRRH